MATLNIKNLSDALYRKLQKRAKKHHRSVAQEVTTILAEAVEQPEPLSILDLQGLGKDVRMDRRRRDARRGGAAFLGLIDDLGSGLVAVDTSDFIYFTEEHLDHLPIVKPLFEQIDADRRMAVTSALTLLEVLVEAAPCDTLLPRTL